MRGKKAPKRDITPDPKFQRIDIAKLINYVMSDGKKTTAQRVVYDAFEIVKKETKQDPRHIFNNLVRCFTNFRS